MTPSIGCELEAGFVDQLGNPADTLAVLDGGRTGVDQFEGLTSDMARSSIELITNVCRSRSDLQHSFDRLAGWIPSGYRAIYATRPFGDKKVKLARKSRVPSMIKALAREHPNGARGVMQIAPNCSTQYHLGVEDAMSRKGVLLLNMLNNIAPYARMRVTERYGITGAEKHLVIWSGFADERRFPAPRWFEGPEHLERYVAAIPKLVTKVGDDWIVAPPDSHSSVRCQDSVGVLWWLARPRLFASGHTVEWRPFPSLEPYRAVELGGDVLELAAAFESFDISDGRANLDPSSDVVRGLYGHLASHSYLVPSAPLTEAEWMRLFII